LGSPLFKKSSNGGFLKVVGISLKGNNVLTAIAVIIVSAVGGGVVGAVLTSQYPANNICTSCQEKAVVQQYKMQNFQHQQHQAYLKEQNRQSEENDHEEFPEDDFMDKSYLDNSEHTFDENKNKEDFDKYSDEARY
jgi:hypothetical protein